MSACSVVPKAQTHVMVVQIDDRERSCDGWANAHPWIKITTNLMQHLRHIAGCKIMLVWLGILSLY